MKKIIVIWIVLLSGIAWAEESEINEIKANYIKAIQEYETAKKRYNDALNELNETGKKQAEQYQLLLNEWKQQNLEYKKQIERAQIYFDRVEKNQGRYENILTTWENQAIQYQEYLDGLKK